MLAAAARATGHGRAGERRARSVAPEHHVELEVPDVGVRLAARAPRVVRGVTRRGHTFTSGQAAGGRGAGGRSFRHEYAAGYNYILEFEFEYEVEGAMLYAKSKSHHNSYTITLVLRLIRRRTKTNRTTV